MANYIARRAIQALFTLLVLSVVIFALTRATGDPAYMMLPPTATDQDVLEMRHMLGTDRSLPVQYWEFVRQAARGHLGDSIHYRKPVAELLRERLPRTAELASVSLSIALVLAFTLGIAAAVKRNSPIDTLARLLGVLGQSMPSFWLGIVMIEVFAVRLKVVPASGIGGPSHLILPSIVLGWYVVAGMMRLLRANLIEVLSTDFIRTARAKGLSARVVIWRHAIRNAVIGVIGVAGVYFALLMTGSVVVETVFAWPGMGRLAYEAILNRDFPVIQGVVLLASVLIVTTNLLIDLLYGVVDPRIRIR